MMWKPEKGIVDGRSLVVFDFPVSCSSYQARRWKPTTINMIDVATLLVYIEHSLNWCHGVAGTDEYSTS
ncbi:MAG TPA: hypothetical protein VF600_08340 [Abditibacteriaceae bacterium]